MLSQIATVASFILVSSADSSLDIRGPCPEFWTAQLQLHLPLGAPRESKGLALGRFRRIFSLVCLFCLILVSIPVPGRASPSFSHVFVVVEENRAYSQIVGNSS